MLFFKKATEVESKLKISLIWQSRKNVSGNNTVSSSVEKAGSVCQFVAVRDCLFNERIETDPR